MSEFGKGFSYCIGLFLAHAERYSRNEEEMEYGTWFNGAADHLFDLQIPNDFPLKEECSLWREKCLEWRLEKYTKDDKDWAIRQAKEFLLAYDKHNKVECEEGDWP